MLIQSEALSEMGLAMRSGKSFWAVLEKKKGFLININQVKIFLLEGHEQVKKEYCDLRMEIILWSRIMMVILRIFFPN